MTNLAFWTIVTAVQNGNGAWKPNLPALPTVRYVNPLDINRLLPNAGAGVNHTHLVIGGIALGSDNDGATGRHEHFVIYRDGSWFLDPRTGAAHTHLGNVPPDYFMCFVVCSDADFVTLTAAPHNVRVIVQATINGSDIGALENTVWSGADSTFWRNQTVNQLGVTLPTEVDRGARLVYFLAGLLLSRRVTDEKGLRLTRIT